MNATVSLSWWARRVCAGRDYPRWADLLASADNSQVGAALAALLASNDPNTVIGASMMIARFAENLPSNMTYAEHAMLDRNLDMACQQQSRVNDYALDSQLEANDVLSVSTEAEIARQAYRRFIHNATGIA